MRGCRGHSFGRLSRVTLGGFAGLADGGGGLRGRLVEKLLNRFPRLAGPRLDLANQSIHVAAKLIEIVVGELSPPFFDLAANLIPASLKHFCGNHRTSSLRPEFGIVNASEVHPAANCAAGLSSQKDRWQVDSIFRAERPTEEGTASSSPTGNALIVFVLAKMARAVAKLSPGGSRYGKWLVARMLSRNHSDIESPRPQYG